MASASHGLDAARDSRMSNPGNNTKEGLPVKRSDQRAGYVARSQSTGIRNLAKALDFHATGEKNPGSGYQGRTRATPSMAIGGP